MSRTITLTTRPRTITLGRFDSALVVRKTGDCEAFMPKRGERELLPVGEAFLAGCAHAYGSPELLALLIAKLEASIKASAH